MGGDLRVGSWGSRLCENDTALDVIDDIESIFSEETDNKAACSRVIEKLKNSYSDADDQSIAWLTAAYKLIPKSGELVSELYKGIRKSSGILSDETIRMLEEKIIECGRRPRQKRTKRPESTWKVGEIYCYDIDPAYADNPELKGYTIGFLCVDFYRYAGVHPLVYTFRSKSSMEEIRANPDIVLNGEFWRGANWNDYLFVYRTILWAEKADEVPLNKLHACGSVTAFPTIPDEVVMSDILYYRRIYFSMIEGDLLRTDKLMHM